MNDNENNTEATEATPSKTISQQTQPPLDTKMDRALDGLTPNAQTTIAKLAVQYKLDQQDPLFDAIRIVYDASRMQIAARKSADYCTSLLKVLPAHVGAAIKDSGTAVRGALVDETKDLGKAIIAAIGTAAQEGATLLQHAAADLPIVAAQQKAGIIEEWKRALAHAAAETAANAGRKMEMWMLIFTALSMLSAGFVGGVVGWKLHSDPLPQTPTQIDTHKTYKILVWPDTVVAPAQGCPRGHMCLTFSRR